AAEKKYGYSDGWASPDWMDECRAKLIEHLGKGDPRDVAAYCAFLWHHGESTAPAAQGDALTRDQQHALREGLETAASDSYFGARPQIDSNDRRKVFTAGFQHGWVAAQAKEGALP